MTTSTDKTALLIAIDFDQTYTADPILFNEFMGYAKFRGHEVVICTVRNYPKDLTHTLTHIRNMGFPVYFTDGLPKRKTMEALGKKVDIWIDDMPEVILEGSKTSAVDLAKWREDQHGILKPYCLRELNV